MPAGQTISALTGHYNPESGVSPVYYGGNDSADVVLSDIQKTHYQALTNSLILTTKQSVFVAPATDANKLLLQLS